MNPVNNILGYRRVYKERQVGECEMCGKKKRLYDDLCVDCRRND
jgi:hypothetical protein